jgi:GTP-binding protein LepA
MPASASKWKASAALGFGFRCGFLGLLHLEIIQERLTREYDLDLITTAPSVVYKIQLTDGTVNRAAQPGRHARSRPRSTRSWEPWIEATIYVFPTNISARILKLCQDRRGIQKNLTYVGGRAQMTYELPLNEVVFDFYDRLKSISRGYASFDYHQIGHREGDLVKMTIMVNAEPVDALSMIVHRGAAEARGRHMCERLKDLIPRHLFKIPIQAAIGGKVIARETIAAMRKDVTAKCYGGDISRKRKLLDKQKEGKKRMRQYGNRSTSRRKPSSPRCGWATKNSRKRPKFEKDQYGRDKSIPCCAKKRLNSRHD